MPNLRIAIATSGRFHVLDLARELDVLGYSVKFYSYVPLRRAERFGLRASCHKSLLPFAFPFLLLQRLLPSALKGALDASFRMILNRSVIWRLEACDVFICMSGIYFEAAEYARRRYGARIYIERGSRHILSQKSILDDLRRRGMNAERVSEDSVRNELACYKLADRIVVASRHVEESFVELGVDRSVIFRNPYGVDLTMFPPTTREKTGSLTVIYVGAWSYRKGVDVLVDACKKLPNVKLLHVGALGDAPLPTYPQFEHYDPVDQWRLKEFYSKADIFVMASREEGLALVQCQALACGLPLVCTTRTGGEDLRSKILDSRWIDVIPPDNSVVLARAIDTMLINSMQLTGLRDLLGSSRQAFTWRSYAERYSEELRKEQN